MPRNKRKFVEKDSSTKYVLLHRSQQDADYGKEGVSNLVLYEVGHAGRAATNKHSQNSQNDNAITPVGARFAGEDHVNAMGLPNDGYDYEKHLKPIGAPPLAL